MDDGQDQRQVVNDLVQSRDWNRTKAEPNEPT